MFVDAHHSAYTDHVNHDERKAGVGSMGTVVDKIVVVVDNPKELGIVEDLVE